MAHRVLGVLGGVVGTTVLFVASAVTATVIHLDVPVTRRLVATRVNEMLRQELAGQVVIEHIGGLGLRGIDGVRVRVKDKAGTQVLFAEGVRVRIGTLDVLRSLVSGAGDLRIPVESASIDYADVSIDGDSAGDLLLANAFAPKNPSPDEPEEADDPAAPGLPGIHVLARKVVLTRAWVHGQAPGAPRVDADVSDLVGHADIAPKLIQADLESVRIVTRGLPRAVDPKGRFSGQLRMPSAKGKELELDAAFDGDIAGIKTAARFRMDGEQVDAVVDGRDQAGQGVTTTLGEVAIREDVTLHAEAHGELPRIRGNAHVALGRSTIDVDAKVDTSDGTKASASVAVRHVDAHAIHPSAPVSDLGLDTHANVAIAKSGAISGEVTLDTLPGRLAGASLPVIAVRGGFTKNTAHAKARIVDPRVTADLEANLTTVGAERVVEAELEAEAPDLSRLPVVGATAKGHASITAQARMSLDAGTFEARAHAIGEALAYGVHSVDDVRVLATARGTLDRPVVDVGVHLAGIASSGQRLEMADVRGRVLPGEVVVIEDAHVDAVKEGHTLGLTASRVVVGSPRIAIEGAVVQGLGETIRGSFSRTAEEIRVTVDAPSIDLARVAAIAGRPDAARGGTLFLAGDVALHRDGAIGELRAKVASLSTSEIEGANMKLDASFAGRTVGVAASADLGKAGSFELATTRVVLGGTPVDRRSWERARGGARFRGSLDLEKVAKLVPKAKLPFSELRGQLVVAGVVRRDSGDVLPEASIHVHTRGLVIAGAAPAEPPHDVIHGPEVRGVQPWRSEGVDIGAEAKVDATSGYVEAAFRAGDKLGTLVSLSAKSELPYSQIVTDPSKLIALAKNAPIRAKVVVPKRTLAELPSIAGTRGLPGTIEAELDVDGTALEPRVDFVAHARGIRSPSVPVSMASDADVELTYDGEKADLAARVHAEKRQVLALSSHVELSARELVESLPGKRIAWSGQSRLALERFPLELVGVLSDRRVRGRVSGEAVIEDLNRDAKLHAKFGLDGLRIGRARFKGGTVAVEAGNGKVRANARIEQKDGYADARAEAGLKWGDALTPALDPNAPLEAQLEAKSFRAAAIQPFVQGAVNALDGRIDAKAVVKMGARGTEPIMEGNITLRDGTLQIPAVGEEFREARAKVSLQSGGVVKIDDVYMRGASGHLTASGVVRTRGLALESATASVHIPRRKALDLGLHGQAIGQVAGDVKLVARAEAGGKKLKVQVDVPNMSITLPQKLKSGVQELAEKENVRVGTYRDPKTFVVLPLDPEDLEPAQAPAPAGQEILMTARLGEITIVQGNQARIVLGGEPQIRITDKTEVTGQIVVKSGAIDVQGKKFEIERGTITFQGDEPENPVVVATAGWTAEDGTKVYADFVGPVKTGKVTLRSEPPRPRDEILAMILFGTADGANAGPAPSGRSTDGTTKAATSLGGGYAAQGLTEAIDDLTGIRATARVDTSRARNPAPEIEVQVSRKISLAFSHVLGTPPLSDPDKNLAIVDWRFRRNWSVELTVGDRGKVQSDVVWQKRY